MTGLIHNPNEGMLAAEKLVEHLQEYVRSGLGNPKTTQLIDPLLAELQELRQYFYNRPKQIASIG